MRLHRIDRYDMQVLCFVCSYCDHLLSSRDPVSTPGVTYMKITAAETEETDLVPFAD